MSLKTLRHPFDPHRQTIAADRVVALAQDIAVNGQLQPIAVRGPMPDDTFEVCYGDRRTYAMEHLRRNTIEGYIYPADTDPLDIRASENLFHEALDPVEEAKIAQRFIDQGLSMPAVCARMGHGAPWITARLAVLAYPPDVRAALAAGGLSLAAAGSLAQIDHDGVRAEYLDEAIRLGASARVVDTWLSHWKADGARMAANNVAIEQIIREAEAYVIHVECQGCESSVDITTTRTLRFCAACVAEVQRAAASPADTTPGG